MASIIAVRESCRRRCNLNQFHTTTNNKRFQSCSSLLEGGSFNPHFILSSSSRQSVSAVVLSSRILKCHTIYNKNFSPRISSLPFSTIQRFSNNNDCSINNVNLYNKTKCNFSTSTSSSITHETFPSPTNSLNNDNNNNNKTQPSSSTSSIILNDDQYDPHGVKRDIYKAAQWNQGTGANGKWDPQFCLSTMDRYEAHLHYILHKIQLHNNSTTANTNKPTNTTSNPNSSTVNNLPPDYTELVSSRTTQQSLQVMLKMKLPTPTLSKRVRELERLIGSIQSTPFTDSLSLQLLKVNGYAGNIGRVIQLLQLRQNRNYKPNAYNPYLEFEYAVQSIQSAGLYLRKNRNVYVKEKDQPDIDNPTRWLDAILMNMSARGVQLTTVMANKMLSCYASTGRSGKAVHFFYKVTQQPIDEDEADDSDDGNYSDDTHNDDKINTTSTTNSNWISRFVQPTNTTTIPNHIKELMPELQQYDNRKGLVRMKMKKHPPYYKLPSDIKSKGLLVKRPRRDEVISKLEWEKDKDWSLSLTAAFAFAESLTYGACGHDPIKLDVTSWNTLIKACCYRGAFLRALHILNDVMPKNGLQPDSYTYNTILSGLARVGDKDYMREMLITMTNKNIPVDKYTVQAMVDGYLNSGDISGAVTLVQDMFNQHQALPPCNTHLKIIEFALSNDLVFEAKRHVYFIQQLWKWKSPLNSSTSGGEGWKKLETAIFVTRNNTKLSRSSLQRLFGYFGEELLDSDFF